jgi:predicted ATPase
MATFQKNTKWVVITGAPSSGKTSVINDLRARGYPVEQEVAREYIEACLAQGQSMTDIRKDHGHVLQSEILRLKKEREAALDPTRCIFMDRGLPDSMTYFRIAGMDTNVAAEASRAFGYAAVFIFDRLPIVHDGVRVEDARQADEIDRMLMQDYKALGYAPVRVPVMPVEDRTDFILGFLGAPVKRPVTP